MGKRRTIPPLGNVIEDQNRFLADFEKETDRGAALVAVAFLEDALGALLRAKCIDSPRIVGGVLSQHWSIEVRTDLAFCFGLIDENQRNDLMLIKDIRNEFGHSHKPVSFGDPGISAMCVKLSDQAIKGETLGSVPLVTSHDARRRFIESASVMTASILLTAAMVDGDKRGEKFP